MMDEKMSKRNRELRIQPQSLPQYLKLLCVCDSGSRSHLERNNVLLLYMLQSPLNITKSIRTGRVESNPKPQKQQPSVTSWTALILKLKRCRTTSHPTPDNVLGKIGFVGRKIWSPRKNAPIRQSVLSRSLKMAKWRFLWESGGRFAFDASSR